MWEKRITHKSQKVSLDRERERGKEGGRDLKRVKNCKMSSLVVVVTAQLLHALRRGCKYVCVRVCVFKLIRKVNGNNNNNTNTRTSIKMLIDVFFTRHSLSFFCFFSITWQAACALIHQLKAHQRDREGAEENKIKHDNKHEPRQQQQQRSKNIFFLYISIKTTTRENKWHREWLFTRFNDWFNSTGHKYINIYKK